MKLIVGLGNPETRYAGTRHNLGFEILDHLAKRGKGKGESWKYEEKFKAEIMDFTLNASRFTLVKPQTYMNHSGMAIKALSLEFRVQSEDIIVIYDELDLPLGKIKVRKGGAAAGHHGVESIINSLGTDQFIRIRLGIGGGLHINAEKFVLESFTHSEKAQVKHMTKQAIKALEIVLEHGLDVAQNQFN